MLDQPVALAQQPLGQVMQRLGAAPQAVAHALRGAPDPGQRAVGGEQHRADAEGHGEHRRARPAPCRAASDSTPPRSSAGIASTGIASTTANTSTLTAVSAVTVAAGGSPARTSIRYCSAAPIAPPPGAILASALPASWDVITGRQRCARSATCCSAHTHASVAAWSPAIAASDASEKRVMSRQEPNTSTMLGKDEVDRDAGDHEPEDRAAQPARRRLRPLDLGRDVGVRLDRVLDAIAERLSVRCGVRFRRR